MKIPVPRRCIFCLARKLTREHVFADWLRTIFPRSADSSHTRGQMTWGMSINGRRYGMPVRSIHQGHSGSRKVKVVCGGCNHGWMSRMETRTRPVLMRLIQGQTHRLSTFDQKLVATWSAKTAMVAEYVHPTHIAVPDFHRLWMYANLEPPPGWNIWIAHYAGFKWRNLAIYHHVGGLTPSGENDTQFTSIGMGHLFIQVASTTIPGIDFAPKDESISDLRRVWPPTGSDIHWPDRPALTDRAADYIAEIGRASCRERV